MTAASPGQYVSTCADAGCGRMHPQKENVTAYLNEKLLPRSAFRPAVVSTSDWLDGHERGEIPGKDCCDDLQAHPDLKTSTNVILHARVQELSAMSAVNLMIGIFTVMYFGVNVVCTVLNMYNCDG